MSNAERRQLADQIGLADELGEPETIVSAVLAVAKRKQGDKWANLVDALEVAQERLERLNAPQPASGSICRPYSPAGDDKNDQAGDGERERSVD
jgi:hypothetical protein